MRRLPRPRPDLEGLTPYRTSDTRAARISLHANESPYPLPDDVMNEILDQAASLEFNRYPAADAHEALVSEIASYAGVVPESVWVGDGSNEILFQASLAFGGPGRRALMFEPTYRMHYRQARMAGTSVDSCPRRDDFSIDIAAALAAIEKIKPDVVFVCTPNNPTGTPTPIEDVEEIASVAPGLVVVDEAYFEFSGATFVPSLDRHQNVLVVRTLSKAFRLAGLRLGYGVADPALLEAMRVVAMPYGQSSFTVVAATIALRRRTDVLSKVPEIIAQRDRLSSRLAKMEDVEVFDSAANFVMVRHRSAGRAVEALAAAGIVVRDFTHLPGCEGCLRITVGRPDENDELLEVLASMLA